MNIKHQIAQHPVILICLALIIMTLTVYWPIQHFEFLTHDDQAYITENPHARDGLTFDSFIWAFSESYEANWHPLTWLSHLLDCELYGLNPKGHHLNNLLFHIANTILLFLILRKTTRTFLQSAFVSALFALHPLHIESVAWVAERKDVLSTFFGFLTIWAYIRFTEQPELKNYALVILLFALSLMAKPMLVTLPFLLILLDYWPLNRFNIITTGESDNKDVPYKPKIKRIYPIQSVLEKIPLFVLSAILSVITILTQQDWGAVKTLVSYPIDVRISNSLVSYFRYIWKMIWPEKLAIFYPYPGDIPLWQVLISGLILTLITFIVIKKAQKYAFLLVGWFWYMGTLIPVIGLVQVGNQSMADRYTYVPLIGLFIIIAWGGSTLLKNFNHKKVIIPIIFMLVISYYALFTTRQLSYWRSGISLFERTLDVTGNNYIAHYNLSILYPRIGNLNKALAHCLHALEIDPDSSAAYFSLGYIYHLKGDIKNSIKYYEESLRLDPDNDRVHNNLGIALISRGREKEAISHFSEALRIKSNVHGAKDSLLNARQEAKRNNK